ncbi:MAG: hypothetical protein ACRCWG_05045 [Sarcina sp.]
MKSKILNGNIFILSLTCLLISLKLFWNMGIYVDEFNTSPDIIFGGELPLLMYWLRLGALTLLCALSGVNLFKK